MGSCSHNILVKHSALGTGCHMADCSSGPGLTACKTPRLACMPQILTISQNVRKKIPAWQAPLGILSPTSLASICILWQWKTKWNNNKQTKNAREQAKAGESWDILGARGDKPDCLVSSQGSACVFENLHFTAVCLTCATWELSPGVACKLSCDKLQHWPISMVVLGSTVKMLSA